MAKCLIGLEVSEASKCKLRSGKEECLLKAVKTTGLIQPLLEDFFTNFCGFIRNSLSMKSLERMPGGGEPPNRTETGIQALSLIFSISTGQTPRAMSECP